jgi:hypothetical protein
VLRERVDGNLDPAADGIAAAVDAGLGGCFFSGLVDFEAPASSSE